MFSLPHVPPLGDNLLFLHLLLKEEEVNSSCKQQETVWRKYTTTYKRDKRREEGHENIKMKNLRREMTKTTTTTWTIEFQNQVAANINSVELKLAKGTDKNKRTKGRGALALQFKHENNSVRATSQS